MVVGLIQLAHKMSRALSTISNFSFPFLRLSSPSSSFWARTLPVCIFFVYILVTNVAGPKSRFYERILLFPPMSFVLRP